MGNAEVDEEGLLIASESTPEVLYRPKAGVNTDIPCYISGMTFDDDPLHDTMAEFVGAEVVRSVKMPSSPKTDSVSYTHLDVYKRQPWDGPPPDNP